MSFPVLLPLVFASSAFVPVSTMPGWLQVFAEHQPVTATVNAVRALTIGGPTTTYVLTAPRVVDRDDHRVRTRGRPDLPQGQVAGARGRHWA